MTQITIGRNAQSTIVVSAHYNTVSGNHATITKNGAKLLLQDHSTNGSYVNGVFVHHQSYEIHRGDVVTLGTEYSLDMNDVYSRLENNSDTVRKFSPQTMRMPQNHQNYQNQQVNINVINHPGGDRPYNEVGNLPKPQPVCINRWNWGAFYFGWLWGVCNGVYWPLIVFIPYLGQVAALIISIILGANGSRYAWEKFTGTATEFDARQDSWANAAGICFIITIIIGVIAGIVIAANI